MLAMSYVVYVDYVDYVDYVVINVYFVITSLHCATS